MQKTDKNNGFTIIETMIVLAIAGLIMLIVFLAVPALQRASRNTSRKNDAGNILTAIGNFVSNNNGVLPASQTDINNAISGIKLGYYTTGSVYYGASTSGTPNTINACPTVGLGGCASSPSEVNTEDVIFLPGTTCSGTTPTQTNASSRSYAIVYEVEASGSASQEECIAS